MMYRAIIEWIKTQLETEFDAVYVGLQDWSQVFELYQNVVEIVPSTATTAFTGLGGIGSDQWEVVVNVGSKQVELTSSEIEKAELDMLDSLMTVIDLFKRTNPVIASKQVRTSVVRHNSERLMNKEEGDGFYVPACSVVIQVTITKI